MVDGSRNKNGIQGRMSSFKTADDTFLLFLEKSKQDSTVQDNFHGRNSSGDRGSSCFHL